MIETSTSASPITRGDDKWLRLARDAYHASSTFFDANVRAQIESDLRQFQSLHPSGSKYLTDAYRARSRIFRPKTRSMLRKNEAIGAEAFFGTADLINVSAIDDADPAHQASAEVMKALLQYRLSKSIPWFLTLNGAYQDAMSVGLVASYQYWEYNAKKKRDRPCVSLIPIENLRFDQAAEWTDVVGTSPYLIRMIPMYVRNVKARMRTIDPKTRQPKWLPLPESDILSAAKLQGDSIRMVREGNRQDSKDQSYGIGDYSIVWVHQNFIEDGDDDWVYYTLGAEKMLSKAMPIERLYWHNQRPFVIGNCVIETHKTYPSSLPRLTKEIQSEVNEIANLRIDNVKFVLNKRYFVKRNTQVDLRSLTRNTPGSATLMTNPETDVKIVETNDVSQSSYQEQDRLNLDFDDLAGTFSQSSVQSNRNLNETVGGMDKLDSAASQVAGYQLRTFVETWVEPVLAQLVLLEQFYETDDVILAVAAKKAKLFERFGQSAVTDELLLNAVTTTVNVGIGATSPTKQVEQFIQAMNALRAIVEGGVLEEYGLDIKEVVNELFGKLGYRDGGRFFKWENVDPQVLALQNQVQKLTQHLLQKGHSPELIAAQIEKLTAEVQKIKNESVKHGVEGAYSAMQAAEVIAAVPEVAPIADEILKGAGYQPVAGGVDPNLPFPDAPAPGIMTQPISNKRTGMVFNPGGNPMSGNTNPMLPKPPASPGAGAAAGIETQRPDGIGPQ